MIELIDIRDMPGYNPAVTNGVDSVSRGIVSWQVDFVGPGKGSNSQYLCQWSSPHCIRHGAMLRVSKEGIYRCGELGCDNGCYYPA